MKRLIKDAAKLDKSINKNDLSFSNIVKAINVVQTEMGITGTTALEAGRTISGSVGAMKSAWANLVTGFADGNADIEGLIDNLVTTIVGDGTESNLGVIGNVLPAIETALGGIAKLIEGAAPKIIEILPGLVTQIVPSLISAATGMVNAVIAVLPDLLNTVVDALIQNAPALITAAIGLVQSLIQGIQDNYQILVDGAIQIVTQLATGILNMLPQIVQLGFDLVVSLASGISENMNELVATVFDLVQYIVDAIIENAPELATAAFGIINEFGNALAQEIPGLSWVFENLETAIVAVTTAVVAYQGAMAIVGIIDSVKNAITAFKTATEGQTIAQTLLNAVMNANPFVLVATLVAALVAAIITLWNTNEGFRNALIKAWESIKSSATTIFTAVADFFTETIPNAFNSVIDWFSDIGEKFADIGNNIISGIKTGISNAWDDLVSWFKGLFGDLIGIAKKILGIASPSKVFKKIGGFTAEGFGVGFEDEFAHVKDDMKKALTFEEASIGINASIKRTGAGQGAFGSNAGGVSIVQNIYSEAKTAADLMMQARYQAEQAVFLSV